MKSTGQYIWALLCIIIIIPGCTNNPASPEFTRGIAIFGYLEGNEFLDYDHAIIVSYTQPVAAYYDRWSAGVKNARVTITDMVNEKVYELRESGNKPGGYYSDSLLILPEISYQLKVEIDDKEITAITTVPPVLEIETELKQNQVNTVYWENLAQQKPIFLDCKNPEQVILLDSYCNESYEYVEFINPFPEDNQSPDQEQYEGGEDGQLQRNTAMHKLRDLTSSDYPNRYVIDWYTGLLMFYGSNTMQVLAIDENFHNYSTAEHPELHGGVNGGVGLFGSYCGATFRLYILK